MENCLNVRGRNLDS